jgi:hypothetical protein
VDTIIHHVDGFENGLTGLVVFLWSGLVKPPKYLLALTKPQQLNMMVCFSTPTMKVRMAQWIRRLPTEQEIPGSSPGSVFTFIQKHE